MGILYNRFAPEMMLLPYSKQNKIVTYATHKNFNTSSWGTGVAPIIGNWREYSDYVYAAEGTNFNQITNTTAIGDAFTIYEVLRHVDAVPQESVADNANITIYRGNEQIGYINDELLSPNYTSEHQWYYDNISNASIRLYCNFSSMNNWHITAVAYEFIRNSKQFNMYEQCNNITLSARWSQPQSTRTLDIESIRIAGNYRNTRNYKFIAVVTEKETATVIANNIAFLKNCFSIQY